MRLLDKHKYFILMIKQYYLSYSFMLYFSISGVIRGKIKKEIPNRLKIKCTNLSYKCYYNTYDRILLSKTAEVIL